MTPLRQRMIDDMKLRNLAPETQCNYIAHCVAFARFYGKSPELLDQEAIREYLLYQLNERRLQPESVNQQVSALKFLYLTTLEMPWGDQDFSRVMRPHRLPVVLSQEEVVQFFDHVPGLRYRAALMLCDGAGLRVSEAVAVKLSDLDSKRMLLRVEQGKGRKDRYAMLSPRLIGVLRLYWRAARPDPGGYLFPSWRPGRHLNASALQQACHLSPYSCLSGITSATGLPPPAFCTTLLRTAPYISAAAFNPHNRPLLCGFVHRAVSSPGGLASLLLHRVSCRPADETFFSAGNFQTFCSLISTTSAKPASQPGFNCAYCSHDEHRMSARVRSRQLHQIPRPQNP